MIKKLLENSYISIFILIILTLTACGSVRAADQIIAGNLGVDGTADIDGNTSTFGTQGSLPGLSLTYADADIDTLTFYLNRNPASFLWAHTATIAAMRLTANHELILYRSDGTTPGITFSPTTNMISLGLSTLYRDATTGALRTNGAIAVDGSATVTGAAVFNGNVTVSSISSPGSGLGSERFGAGAFTGSAQFSLALGNGATVATGKDRQVAIGSGATTNSPDSIAIGAGSTVTTGNIGYGIALGRSATAGDDSSIAIGAFATATGGRNVAVGYNSSVTGTYGTAIGWATSVVGSGVRAGSFGSAADSSVAVGYGAVASGVYGAVVGHNSQASGTGVTLGAYTTAANDGVAIGYQAKATGAAYSTAIGRGATVTSGSGVAIGANSAASGDWSIALGYGASASSAGGGDRFNAYFGNGNVEALWGGIGTAAGYYVRHRGTTPASGNGGNFIIAGGKGATASDASGDVILQTAVAGGGTALVDNLRVAAGGRVIFSPSNFSLPAWAAAGALSSWVGSTVTDSSTTASSTAPSAVFYSFAAPLLAAVNASVRTTDAATVYIAGGPSQGTNQTITNSWGLWNAGKSRFDGAIASGSTITNTAGNGIVVDRAGSSFNAQLTVNCSSSLGGAGNILFQDGGYNKWALGYNTGGAAFGLYDYTASAGLAMSLASGSKIVTFASTVSGTSTTAAAILGKSMGLTENLFVGGNLSVAGSFSAANWSASAVTGTASGLTLTTASNSDLRFAPNGSGHVVIPGGTNGGNLPSDKIQVGAGDQKLTFLGDNTNTGNYGGIRAYNTVYANVGAEILFTKPAANLGAVSFSTNNGVGLTEALRIEPNQQVSVLGNLRILGGGNGTGNLPPDQTFVIGTGGKSFNFLNNDSAGVNGIIGSWNTGYNVQDAKIVFNGFGGHTTNIAFFTSNTASAPNEVMRLDHNGNVGIDTTNPTEKLDIAGNAKVSGKVMAASARFDGPVRLAPQGDISMGSFTSEP